MPSIVTVSLVVLTLLAALFLLHALLPELLFHWLHIGTFYKGLDTDRALSLTFDDGPDDRSTPMVLDILRKYEVKATFFVIADNAVKHPDLIHRIIAEGHEIAAHSVSHRHAWLQGPVNAFRQVRKAKQALEQLTGRTIRFYRPPWGAFSLISRLAMKSSGVRPVLWSGRAMDWLPDQTSASIRQNIINGTRPGAIILCHDAGGPGAAEDAPLQTIAALPEVIELLQALQYKLHTVGSMYDARELAQGKRATGSVYASYSIPRRLLIYTWTIVEVAFTLIYKIQSLDGIFRFNRSIWSFGERTLSSRFLDTSSELLAATQGGTAPAGSVDSSRSTSHSGPPAGSADSLSDMSQRVIIRDGMPVLDLHFQNKSLTTFAGETNPRVLVQGLRQTKEGLRHVAAMLQYHPDYRDIQAITGITLINRGIEALGFHVEEVPSVKEKRRLEKYMRFLMGLYHPEGFRRLREQNGHRGLQIKHVWMSRDELLQRYGKGEEDKHSHA